MAPIYSVMRSNQAYPLNKLLSGIYFLYLSIRDLTGNTEREGRQQATKDPAQNPTDDIVPLSASCL